MAIPDRELEHSSLSGLFTRDGITVEVQIYRFAGTADAWVLEVVDQEGSSTVWTESFFTDQAAHKAFLHAVEKDGMGQIFGAGRDAALTITHSPRILKGVSQCEMFA